jgi:hypothetical protein
MPRRSPNRPRPTPAPRTPTIFALDPGVTTGLAILYAGAIKLSQLNLQQIAAIPDLLHETPPEVIVMEDFQSNPAKNLGGRASVDPIFAPVRVSAMIEVYAALHNSPIKIVYQLPSDKAMMNDQRLQIVHPHGFKATRGLPHARDALRHLEIYLRRTRARNPETT